MGKLETNLNRYTVNIVIENKPLIRDPEGETILRDLIIKNGVTEVTKVRSAKLLKLEINAIDKENAKNIVERICNDLRLFNPVVSICNITVSSDI